MVLYPQLLRHQPRGCRRAIALGGMVAGSDKSHAHFPRQVRLGLGDFAGNEGVGPGCVLLAPDERAGA